MAALISFFTKNSAASPPRAMVVRLYCAMFSLIQSSTVPIVENASPEVVALTIVGYKRLVTSRPFRVLGIQQIAIGGLDKAPLSELWSGLFGIEKVNDYRSESENVDEDILSLGSGAHAVEIDLMQPIDPERSPKVHSPALNHIGLWIDDLPQAVEWLSAQGMRFTPGGIRKGASGYDVCFLHPKGNEAAPLSGQGVLIELVQAPDDVVAALS